MEVCDSKNREVGISIKTSSFGTFFCVFCDYSRDIKPNTRVYYYNF